MTSNPILYVVGDHPEVRQVAEEIGWTVLGADLLPEMPQSTKMPVCLAMVNAADCVYVSPQSEKISNVEVNFADSQQKMFLYNNGDLHWFYMMLNKSKSVQLSMNDMRRKEYAS